MAINEQILTGRKWRRLIDKAAGLWQRISYWTHSSDVEFNDGKNAETKVGAIDGITDSLASTSSRIAASAKSVNQLNNNLTFPDGTKFYPDVKDGVRGFNTDPARGADTFSPFRQDAVLNSSVVKFTTSKDPLVTPHTDTIQLTKGTWLIVLTATGNSSGTNIGTPSINGAVKKSEYNYSGGLSNARQKLLLVEVENTATITVTVAFPGNNGVDLWAAWKLY